MNMRARMLLSSSLMLWAWYLMKWRDLWAQVREDSDVLLAPALEVFAGTGTPEELYYVSIIVVGVGLLVAIVAVNVTVFLQKFTFQLMVKILTVWLVFAAGVSVFSLNLYLNSQPTGPVLRADEQAQPRQIKTRIETGQLVVSWKTEKETIGQLVYTSSIYAEQRILLSNGAKASNTHVVVIPIHTNEHEFWISIMSDGLEYRLEGKPLYIKIE